MNSYSKPVLAYFKDDSHVGGWPIKACATDIITLSSGDIAQGTRLQLQFHIERRVGSTNSLLSTTIRDVKFRVFGEPTLVACMAYVAEFAVGKTVAQLAALKASAIDTALLIATDKHYCSIHVTALLQQLTRGQENRDD